MPDLNLNPSDPGLYDPPPMGVFALSGARSLGPISTHRGGDPPTHSEVQALRDKCEELADDVRALSTLVHALRRAFVAVGVIKGGA